MLPLVKPVAPLPLRSAHLAGGGIDLVVVAQGHTEVEGQGVAQEDHHP